MENLSTNENTLALYIAAWIKANRTLKEFNHILYERTELYEHGYERNFNEKLHNFFAKKITRFSKEENELLNLLNGKILKAIIKEV